MQVGCVGVVSGLCGELGVSVFASGYMADWSRPRGAGAPVLGVSKTAQGPRHRGVVSRALALCIELCCVV